MRFFNQRLKQCVLKNILTCICKHYLHHFRHKNYEGNKILSWKKLPSRKHLTKCMPICRQHFLWVMYFLNSTTRTGLWNEWRFSSWKEPKLYIRQIWVLHKVNETSPAALSLPIEWKVSPKAEKSRCINEKPLKTFYATPPETPIMDQCHCRWPIPPMQNIELKWYVLLTEMDDYWRSPVSSVTWKNRVKLKLIVRQVFHVV